jgi:amidohydrolase
MNDPGLGELWQIAAAKVVGADNVVEHDSIMTGGDDAAYYQQRVPGVYWWLGIRNEEKGFVQPLHSPNFNFNEEVLVIGAAVQVQVAFDYLKAM